MKFNERLNIIIRAIIIAQQKGKLSIDDAYASKLNIDEIRKLDILNDNFTNALSSLISIAEVSATNGAYTLEDSYNIYLAISGIFDIINAYRNSESLKQDKQPEPEQPEQNEQTNVAETQDTEKKAVKKSKKVEE